MTRIVVGDDFSPGARWAVERAARLPFAADATLHIIHVLPGPVGSELDRGAERAAAQRLEAAASALMTAQEDPRKRLAISTEIARGSVDVEILRLARHKGADLVVLGPPGARSRRRLLSGSTAERVLRKTDRPVLVVKARPTGRYERPLAALDLSDAARGILELATRVVGPSMPSLPVLHAYHVAFEARLRVSLPEAALAQHVRELEARAREELRSLLQAIGDIGVRLAPRMLSGDPATVIAREAWCSQADLVVMGTHGRTGVARWLRGSTAASAVRGAPCDVLVARPTRFAFKAR